MEADWAEGTPDEILLKIFLLLRDARTRLVLSRVCARWRSMVMDRALWQQHIPLEDALLLAGAATLYSHLRVTLNINMRSFHTLDAAAQRGLALSGLGYITQRLYASIEGPAKIADALRPFAGSVLTGLEINTTNGDELEPVLTRMTGLTHLTLTISKAPPMGKRHPVRWLFFDVPSLASLRLSLTRDTLLDADWFTDGGAGGQGLKPVRASLLEEFHGNAGVVVRGRPFFVADHFPRLQTLSLLGMMANDVQLFGLPPAPPAMLTKLSLFTDRNARLLERPMPCLTTLVIYDGAGDTPMPVAVPVEHVPRLCSLTIVTGRVDSAEWCLELFAFLSDLQEVFLRYHRQEDTVIPDLRARAKKAGVEVDSSGAMFRFRRLPLQPVGAGERSVSMQLGGPRVRTGVTA